uniref:Uncharacterized protein n=1 Tax=Panagrolaimus sp. PS1159 TaxID=55785 RepID=A0AC35GXA4_9BILA
MKKIDEPLFCLKGTQKCFVNDISENENSDRFSNLNLKPSSKCPILNPVQSCYKPKNEKYCDSTASDNCEIKQKLQQWNKSSKINTFPTPNNELNADLKKRWKNENILNITNNRPLSLHISAYENSIEASAFDSFPYENSTEASAFDSFRDKNVERLKMKKFGSVKIFKQSLTEVFKSQNPFEFPRQQNGGNKPEVMQFKAFQQLGTSNQPSSSKSINFYIFISFLFISDLC